MTVLDKYVLFCFLLQVAIGHWYTTFYSRFAGEHGEGNVNEFGGGNAVQMFFIMSGFLMTFNFRRLFHSFAPWSSSRRPKKLNPARR